MTNTLDSQYYTMRHWPERFNKKQKAIIWTFILMRGILWRGPWCITAMIIIFLLCICTFMLTFRWQAAVDCWQNNR